MSPRDMPVAEVTLTEQDVRTLLREQHPDLAHLPLSVLANGWDNVLMRLGEDLLVRLPRREAAARLVEHEQRWLPELAPHLPLPVPLPVRTGRPSAGYPWSWSITRFLPGETASAPPAEGGQIAEELGHFLAQLHRPAPADAPRNPFRGVPLRERDERFRDNLGHVSEAFDHREMLDVWAESLAAAPWTGVPVWLHGDLHPANLLLSGGHVTAVVDFGDVTGGDPATDLAVAWMLLRSQHRPVLWAAYADRAQHLVDGALEARARGWALAFGVVFLAGSADNPAMHRIGVQTVAAVLEAAPP